jgi:hypothetical protein
MKDGSIYSIVCGMPRCGTRQFTDFLNRDDRICIQAEIRSGLIPHIYKLVMTADDEYMNGKQQKYFNEKRYAAVVELFSFFSKGPRKFKETASFQGFKTPGAELQHKMLCSIILPSVHELVFFYCIRNIKDCYLSLAAMPWFKRTPEQFINGYIKSLKRAIRIYQDSKSDNSKTRICMLHLDDFIASAGKADWISNKLFGPLGIILSQAEAEAYIQTTENRNSTLRATGSKRETVLSENVKKIFQSKIDEVNTVVANFNDAFGANLASL